MLVASYEAEQHLLHFGRSDVPACWTICGLTSGYISRSAGKEIYVLEDRCMGKGDAACHLFGRTREEWGDERAEELRFFEPNRLKECLDVSLHRVTETPKAAERRIREHRRALIRVARDVEEPLGIVSKSPTMRQIVDLARRVAKVDSTVLITGESGSGKERIARLVHEESFAALYLHFGRSRATSSRASTRGSRAPRRPLPAPARWLRRPAFTRRQRSRALPDPKWHGPEASAHGSCFATCAAKGGASRPREYAYAPGRRRTRSSSRCTTRASRSLGIHGPLSARPSSMETQAPQPAKGTWGSGSFIVREIVWAHGGTVSVESSEAHGTTFRVVLPHTRAP
jgi:hypothetical protein